MSVMWALTTEETKRAKLSQRPLSRDISKREYHYPFSWPLPSDRGYGRIMLTIPGTICTSRPVVAGDVGVICPPLAKYTVTLLVDLFDQDIQLLAQVEQSLREQAEEFTFLDRWGAIGVSILGECADGQLQRWRQILRRISPTEAHVVLPVSYPIEFSAGTFVTAIIAISGLATTIESVEQPGIGQMRVLHTTVDIALGWNWLPHSPTQILLALGPDVGRIFPRDLWLVVLNYASREPTRSVLRWLSSTKQSKTQRPQINEVKHPFSNDFN